MVEGLEHSQSDHTHRWKVECSKGSQSDAQCLGCGSERSFPGNYEELRRVTLQKAGIAESKKFNVGLSPQRNLAKRFAAADVLDGDSWSEDSSRDVFESDRYAPINDSYE